MRKNKKIHFTLSIVLLTLLLTLTITNAGGGGYVGLTTSKGWVTFWEQNLNEYISVHVSTKDYPAWSLLDADGVYVYEYSQDGIIFFAVDDPNGYYHPSTRVITPEERINYVDINGDFDIETLETYYTTYDRIINDWGRNGAMHNAEQLTLFDFPRFDMYAHTSMVVEMARSINGREIFFPIIHPLGDLGYAPQRLQNLAYNQNYAFLDERGIYQHKDEFSQMESDGIYWMYVELDHIGFPFDIVMPLEIYEYFEEKAYQEFYNNGGNNGGSGSTKKPSTSEFYACKTNCVLDGSNAVTSFPEGTKEIHLTWVHGHIPYGADYTRVWTKDGKEWIRYECKWDKNESWTQVSLSMKEPMGFASGDWKMTVYVDGQQIFSKGFTVKGNHNYWDPVGTVDRCFWK